MSDLLKISNSLPESNEQMADFMRYQGLEPQFVSELTRSIQEAKSTVYYQVPPPEPDWSPFRGSHGSGTPAEIIISLASAGVFSVTYQAIASFFARNQGRELTLTKGDVTITIKGHSLPDETELIEKLAPELLGNKAINKSKKKRPNTIR